MEVDKGSGLEMPSDRRVRPIRGLPRLLRRMLMTKLTGTRDLLGGALTHPFLADCFGRVSFAIGIRRSFEV